MVNKPQNRREMIFGGLFALMALTGLAFGILQVWDLTVLQNRSLTHFEVFSRATHLMWWPLVFLLLLLSPRLGRKNTEKAQ